MQHPNDRGLDTYTYMYMYTCIHVYVCVFSIHYAYINIYL